VVRSRYGEDVDFLERMFRVFNTKGDLRLTFHEMLDGLAILLSGSAEQKFELFFLMYCNVDQTRVGSGKRLDRQAGERRHRCSAVASTRLLVGRGKKTKTKQNKKRVAVQPRPCWGCWGCWGWTD
jgi:hypothetical protein